LYGTYDEASDLATVSFGNLTVVSAVYY